MTLSAAAEPGGQQLRGRLCLRSGTSWGPWDPPSWGTVSPLPSSLPLQAPHGALWLPSSPFSISVSILHLPQPFRITNLVMSILNRERTPVLPFPRSDAQHREARPEPASVWPGSPRAQAWPPAVPRSRPPPPFDTEPHPAADTARRFAARFWPQQLPPPRGGCLIRWGAAAVQGDPTPTSPPSVTI